MAGIEPGDFSKARSENDPFEPLGREPVDGEPFCIDENGYHVVKDQGILHPGFFKNLEVVRKAREEFELRADDVCVITYPKCGTTWMQQLVVLLLNEGKGLEGHNFWDCSLWLDKLIAVEGMQHMRDWNPPVGKRRVLKSHCHVRQQPYKLPPTIGAKRIIVGRNVYDTAVSMFHHSLDVTSFKYTGSWKHFLHDLFSKGFVESSLYWEWYGMWYAEWQKEKDLPEDEKTILWVRFEDMKADLPASIRTVAKFLGIEASEEVVEKVATACGFDAMKKQFEEADKKSVAEGRPIKKNHIRQGKSGAWRHAFTVAEYDAFTAVHKELSEKYNLPLDTFDTL